MSSERVHIDISADDRFTPRIIHAIVFNAITRGLGEADRFVALSERDRIAHKVITELDRHGLTIVSKPREGQ